MRRSLITIAISQIIFPGAYAEEPQQITLPPITVTARGITERISEVPFGLDVINGETSEKRKWLSLEESLHNIPGIAIDSSGNVGATQMLIRGSGSLAHTSLDDQSVAINIDGASYGIVGLAQNLYDLEQIDIAKGPQGTLFGSNSEAGAINVQTRQPQPYREGSIELGMGNYNMRRINAMFNTPTGHNSSLRIAALAESEDDYIVNSKTGAPLNSKTNKGVRVKWRWLPNQQTDIVLGVAHDQRRNYLPLFLTYPFGHPPTMIVGDIPNDAMRKTDSIDLKVQYDLSNLQLHSQTHLHRHKGEINRFYLAMDTLPMQYQQLQVPPMFHGALNDYFSNPANNSTQQTDNIHAYSQELRLNSHPQADTQWVAGVYLSRNKRDYDYDARRGILNQPPFPPLSADAYNAVLQRNYQTDTQAVFGEVTHPLNQRSKLIGGARLTHEHIRSTTDWQPNTSPLNQPFASFGNRHDEQNISDTFLTGRIGMNYALDNNWHAYGLYSRGHKSAGFADLATNIAYGKTNAPYHAGKVDAFELGIKGEASDQHWGVSLATFHTRTKDDHLNIINYPIPIVETKNADTRSSGIELSGYYQINPQWRVHGAAAYTNAKITKGPEKNEYNLKVGADVPFVPKWDITAGATWQKPISIGGKTAYLQARTDVHHSSKRPAYGQDIYAKAYTLVDASLGIDTDFGDISVWGKNLTNEDWALYTLGFDGKVSAGVPGRGRSYGINYRYDF